MILGFAPIICLCGLLSLATFAVGALQLRSEATEFRLQTCARRITSSREELHRFLAATNRQMKPLQNTVYLARGASFIPGFGAAAGLGEKAALAALRLIETAQNSRIASHQILETRHYRCPPTRSSTQSILCGATPFLHGGLFRRSRALFPDVPGLIRWKEGPLARARCFSAKWSFAIQLEGPEAPEDGGWKHQYEI